MGRRETVGICCVKCSNFLTEQLRQGIFVCRKCNIFYPMCEDSIPYGDGKPGNQWGTARTGESKIYLPLDEFE
jgi:hypothetical protein